MAALRGSTWRLKSHSNSAQLLFFRGISSKLFVKGLSFSTTEMSLSDAFSQYGKVIEAKIIKNKDGTKSKGYGYVTFSAVDEAQKALIDMNGKLLDGRVVFVDNVRSSQSWDRPKLTGPPKAEADS